MLEESERILVENLSKKFDFGYKKRKNILSKIISLIDRENKKELQVLKNISFKAYSGDTVGIIGLNGSGKSTLLRIIAGVYSFNEGVVKTNGKIIYLNGFSHGLKPKLTMKENIFLVGSIMGLSQRDIKAKLDEITDFSELREFIDIPLYKFSSGMISRLNFSIIIHCLRHHNPDILLLDEVFGAGGDIKFKIKAMERMNDLIKTGTTVLLVSHNLDVIKQCCNRVILMDKGEIIAMGKPGDIIKKYEK